MSWYDPTSWDPKRVALAAGTFGLSEAGGLRPIAQSAGFNPLADPGADAERQRKQLLYEQALKSGGFADTAQTGYGQLGGEAAAQRDYLRRLASGQDSVSAEQLRQGLQQNQAAQASYAAGASPQNAAMAARTAAIQSARLGAGMSGAAALAGLQERQAANQGLSNMILQQRGQDLNATLGARQGAIQGYGAGNAGTPEKSWLEKYGPALQSGASAIAASDRRLKKDIKDGDGAANKAIAGLRAYAFKYKDSKHGEGKQTGVMAQDMERAGLKHAVIDTPDGKMVHGAKAATSALALVGALGRRVARLEGGGR